MPIELSMDLRYFRLLSSAPFSLFVCLSTKPFDLGYSGDEESCAKIPFTPKCFEITVRKLTTIVGEYLLWDSMA